MRLPLGCRCLLRVFAWRSLVQRSFLGRLYRAAFGAHQWVVAEYR